MQSSEFRIFGSDTNCPNTKHQFIVAYPLPGANNSDIQELLRAFSPEQQKILSGFIRELAESMK